MCDVVVSPSEVIQLMSKVLGGHSMHHSMSSMELNILNLSFIKEIEQLLRSK